MKLRRYKNCIRAGMKLDKSGEWVKFKDIMEYIRPISFNIIPLTTKCNRCGQSYGSHSMNNNCPDWKGRFQ